MTFDVRKDMDTTFDEMRAREATTKEEAQQVIREFIREGQELQSRHNVAERSHGYDLYLPWLIEVIEYVKTDPEKEILDILHLQRLFMDSAWDLVMQGVLRPGPKQMAGGGDGHGYGVAYSLVEGAKL